VEIVLVGVEIFISVGIVSTWRGWSIWLFVHFLQ